jgi:hypothetical protein
MRPHQATIWSRHPKREVFLIMRISLLICCALALAGCSAGDNSAAPPPPVSSPTTTSTSGGKLAAEWTPKFTALTGKTDCAGNVSTQSCAELLTEYVVLTEDLRSAITQSGEARYANTLSKIQKVSDAGEAYAAKECRLHAVRDSQGNNVCEGFVIDILTGAVTVQLALKADDLGS